MVDLGQVKVWSASIDDPWTPITEPVVLAFCEKYLYQSAQQAMFHGAPDLIGRLTYNSGFIRAKFLYCTQKKEWNEACYAWIYAANGNTDATRIGLIGYDKVLERWMYKNQELLDW